MKRVVKIAAHRGAMSLAPQNTLPAFQKAVEQGADMIEIDVHTTSDSELVVIHNSAVEGLTDGTGAVADMTLRQIKALDAAVGRHAGQGPVRIPTLQEALQFVKQAGIEVNVEIKSAQIDSVIECVRSLGLESVTMVSSPNHTALRQAKRICPEISTLAMGIRPETLEGVIRDFQPDALNFNRHTLNEESYRVALKAGLVVYQSILGENDNEAGAHLAIWLGADILETDFPGESKRLVERWGLAASRL